MAKALRAGGDDCLGKPFALAELIARVETLGGRSVGQVQISDTIEVGALVIGRPHGAKGERKVDLATREVRILSYLAPNAGRGVTRSMLLENVWD